MDIAVKTRNNIEIDKILLQKMVFVFNAVNDGWSVKRKGDSYVFTKNHEGKKEILTDEYLGIFVKDNFDINKLLS